MITRLVLIFCTVALVQGQAPVPSYERFLTGNAQDSRAKPKAGFMLAGGGKDDDASFRWLLERSGGGDVVVLRASGTDAYNPYIAGLGKVDSVETILFHTAAAAADPYVIERIRNAEAIFLAGGDQWNYLRMWKGTAVGREINAAIRRGVPVGGTSAGLAVLGEYGFSAEHDTVTSAEALKNPFDEKVSISRDFLHVPHLDCLITDSHFSKRDRMGRLLVFLGRIRQEGKCSEVRGIGVDERAVVLMNADGTAKVSGEGAAYFIRLRQTPELKAGVPASIPAMDVVRVETGRTFDIAKWRGVGISYSLRVMEGVVRAGAGTGIYGL